MSSSYRGMYIVQPPRLVALFFFPSQNSWDSLGLADAGEKRREAAGGGGGGGGRQRINDRIVRGWLFDAEDTFNGERARRNTSIDRPDRLPPRKRRAFSLIAVESDRPIRVRAAGRESECFKALVLLEERPEHRHHCYRTDCTQNARF